MEEKQIIEGNKPVAATKGGRCFNGCHRDSGTIVHYVKPLPESVCGFWGDKSLCGTEPGRRGYGWSASNKQVNCDKCIKMYNSAPNK